MSTNYKLWCRFCGDLRSQTLIEENILDLLLRVIEFQLPPHINICINCHNQLLNFHTFVRKFKDVNEMFKGLDDEDENDLCIRRLNAYRSHFKMSTMIETEANDIKIDESANDDEEVFEYIEDDLIEDQEAIVEEILVETIENDAEMNEIDEDAVDETIEATSDDERTYMYHMTESNKLLKLFTFKCHLCPQPAYPNMRLLTEHCQMQHNTQPSVKCCSSECGKMLQTWRRLMIHKEKHFPSQEAMTCEICHTVFATRTGFENHKKTHERQFICSFCAKPFSEQKTLRFHEETHRAPLESRKSFECPQCRLKFITKQACQNHISMKHEKVIKVICPHVGCGKGFFTRKAMLEHQRTHREKSFKCSECDFMSKTKSQLNAHLERHVRDSVKKLECEKCGIEFEGMRSWKSHLATHTQETSYSCNKCEEKFNEKSDLSIHMKLHNEL